MALRWIVLAALATLLLAAAACGAGEPMTGEAAKESDPCGTRSSSKEEFLTVAPNGMALHIKEVWHKYRSLFLRQPHRTLDATGLLRHEGVHPAGTMGIVIHVRERVDQTTLPLEDRIPDCLEGIPVQILEAPHARPSSRSGEQVNCREQWEAVRLPKEMEDLLQTDTRRLTSEERERKYRAADQIFARIREVFSANRELFSRQPNLLAVKSGLVGTDLPSGQLGIGLKVHVAEIVPQWKLPPQDRIPCVIDGVPIEVTTDPLSEYLGGETSWHRPLMAGVGIQAPNIRGVG